MFATINFFTSPTPLQPLLDIGLYIFKLTTAIGAQVSLGKTMWNSSLDKCHWIFWRSVGLFAQGPASMMAYLLISGLFLTRLRRPIGKMTVTEQKYEGEYRYVNSRLITNRWAFLVVSNCIVLSTINVFFSSNFDAHFYYSEEIAFYNGNVREKQTIHSTFKKLVSMWPYESQL